MFLYSTVKYSTQQILTLLPTSPPSSGIIFFIIAMNKIFKDDLQKKNGLSVHYSICYVHLFKKQACYTVVPMYS